MPDPDRRTALIRSYRQAAGIVAGVRPDQVTGPTPCADYDVAALVDHLVGAEIEPPADASGWERLAAFMGRSPRHWRPAPT